MSVRYRLSAPRPDDHRLRVVATFSAGPADLVFPVWAPGSYLVRSFDRMARDFAAHTPDGHPVALTRVAHHRWRVLHDGPFVLRYEVYCREKSVRTPFVDEELTFFLPSNVLVYDEAHRDEGYEVQVDVPAGHTGVCFLGPEVQGPAVATWRTASLDALMDAPIAVGAFQHTSFEVQGIAHHHWVEPGHNGDLAKINDQLRAVVTTAAATVGGPLPYARYDFVTLLARSGHGGLEHKDGSVLLRPRRTLRAGRDVEELITLAAHEHFHAWNVKRIHPDTLGPAFDYSREHYTRELWWLEGGTVYYEERIAYRAGIVDEARYLERMADLVKRVLDAPGRHHQSLQDASFDAWVKLYQPGEDAANSTVSYYTRGALVVWVLDLWMLHLTGGTVGMDAVLRHLWAEYGARGIGYPEADPIRAIVLDLLRAADVPDTDLAALGRLYDAHVRGTETPQLAAALDLAGLDFTPVAPRASGWLGLRLGSGDRVIVEGVREDGPACGVLSVQDELLAVDGERILGDNLGDRLRDAPPGTALRVLLSRAGRILERTVTTAAAPPSEWKVTARPAPDPRRAAVRAAWLRGQ